jgi:hypothetical protein
MRASGFFAERHGDDQSAAAGFYLQPQTALHLGVIETIIRREFGCDCWEYTGPHKLTSS